MTHPIADVVFTNLERKGAGLQVTAAGLEAVRADLNESGTRLELVLAARTLVELAFMLETQQGSPAAAAALRGLVKEVTPRLRAFGQQARERRGSEARARHQGFVAMMGGPARTTKPAAPGVPTMKASALLQRVLR